MPQPSSQNPSPYQVASQVQQDGTPEAEALVVVATVVGTPAAALVVVAPAAVGATLAVVVGATLEQSVEHGDPGNRTKEVMNC